MTANPSDSIRRHRHCAVWRDRGKTATICGSAAVDAQYERERERGGLSSDELVKSGACADVPSERVRRELTGADSLL